MALPIIHYSSAPMPTPADKATFSAVTWNIKFAERTHRAIYALHRDEPWDVVLLQEMDERGTAEIADHFDLNYAYVALSVHPQSGRNFGNAVLSPWPLADVEVVDLPFRATIQGQPRAALGVTIHHSVMPVRVFSVHTETPVLTHRKRLLQFVTLGDAVERWRALPTVVGGDFNTASARSVKAVTTELERRSLVRASQSVGPTLRRAGRNFELDHLFISGLQTDTVGLIEEHSASDHDAIWARLAWEISDETTGGRQQTS